MPLYKPVSLTHTELTHSTLTQGVNRRAIAELIRIANTESDTLTVSVAVSMFEVYNEKVFDLLDASGIKDDSRALRIREDSTGGTHLNEFRHHSWNLTK